MDSSTRPINDRSDQELFEILVEENYFQEVVVQAAKSELQKRGFGESDITRIVSELQSKINNEQILEEAEMAKESFGWLEWINFVLLFPFTIFDDWGLASEGYTKKSRQRTLAFVCGLFCWLVFIYVMLGIEQWQAAKVKNSVNEVIKIRGQHRYHKYLILVLESDELKLDIDDFIQTSNAPYEEWPKPIDAFFVNDSLQIVGDMSKLPASEVRSKFIQIWPPSTTSSDTIFSPLGKLKLNVSYDSIDAKTLSTILERNVIFN